MAGICRISGIAPLREKGAEIRAVLLEGYEEREIVPSNEAELASISS